MNLWFFNETLFTTPTSPPGFSVKLLHFAKKRFRTNYKPETDIELDWQFSVNSPRSIFQMKLSSLRRLLLQDRGSSLYSSCPREFNSALLNILSLTEWCLTLLPVPLAKPETDIELDWQFSVNSPRSIFLTETEAGSGSSVISKWLPLPAMSLVKLWEWELIAGWAFSVLLCEAKLCRLGRDGSKLEKLWWLLRGHSYIT